MSRPQQYFTERPSGGEHVILVQLNFGENDFKSRLDEFVELADSAKVKVADVVTGSRQAPSAKYFMGQGKAEEILQLVKQLKADAVIVNHELSAAQGRNLEELFKCRVLDRTELILDIFAQRAHSAEGKLQVELAQLKHLRTRLIRGWTHLERQKGGIGLRGPGETQLETDRRLIDIKIKAFQKRLEKVSEQRQHRRRARQRRVIPMVSLVGYTNAGKSTLFNQLTHADVYAAHQLFATLDPTLRKIHLAPIDEVIIADTVGFIRDLPPDLIAAFRATLEETCEADLILHVIDYSHPNSQKMIQNVNTILKEIGADEPAYLEVYNKIDLIEGQMPSIEYNIDHNPKLVRLSAKSGKGVDLLLKAMTQILQDPIVLCEVILAPEESKLRAQLYELGAVEKEETNDQGDSILQLKIRRIDSHRLLGNRIVLRRKM